MSDTSVIREYLVALGFKIDQASFKKFEQGLAGAAAGAARLGAVVEAAAATVDVAVVKIADSLDRLYWSTQRIGSSATNIRAFEYSVGQLGGSAAGARNALESLALFIRSNPGASGWLGAIGVQTKDAAGRLRDTEQVAEDLGRRLRAMPQYRAIRYAQMLGIDYNTLLAMERGASGYSEQYRTFARNIGADLTGGASGANRFMTSVRELRAELGLLLTKVGSDLINKWGPSLQAFMVWTGQHSHEIATRIETWTERVARFGAALFGFLLRVVGLIERLDKATNGWSSGIIAVLAALWASGAGGLVGALITLDPLIAGAVVGIMALVGALGALYADYSKWKAGGASLIDWGPWAAQVSSLVKDVGELSKSLADLGSTLSVKLGPGFKSLLTDILNVIDLNVKALGHLARALDDLLNGRFRSAASEAAAWIADSAKANAVGATALPRAVAATVNPGAGPPQKPGGSFGQVRKMFESLGWSPEQAAGLAANVQAESGFIANRVGDHGAAYGLAQWHSNRQAAFRKLFGHDIRNSTFAEQIAFIDYELRKGSERAAGAKLLKARSAMEAGAIVSTYYERPASSGEAARRGALAAQGLHAPIAPTHGGAHVSLHHKTDIHVDGARDPHAVGRAVVSSQNQLWNDTLRNAKSVLR